MIYVPLIYSGAWQKDPSEDTADPGPQTHWPLSQYLYWVTIMPTRPLTYHSPTYPKYGQRTGQKSCFLTRYTFECCSLEIKYTCSIETSASQLRRRKSERRWYLPCQIVVVESSNKIRIPSNCVGDQVEAEYFRSTIHTNVHDIILIIDGERFRVAAVAVGGVSLRQGTIK